MGRWLKVSPSIPLKLFMIIKYFSDPWQVETKFAHDITYSFYTTMTSAVYNQTSLATTASYDHGVGKAISETEHNGHNNFDVLGREIETSEGVSPNSMTVIERREYTLLFHQAVCVRKHH